MEGVIILAYDISVDDFTRAGEANSSAKRELKQMGVSPDATREVTITICGGEINMVIHAKGGVITVETTTEKVRMTLTDVDPGIPDMRLTMQAGYSTTPDEIRSLGFGAGVGLLNMKKYLDSMDTDTRIDEGAATTMVVNPQNVRMKE